MQKPARHSLLGLPLSTPTTGELIAFIRAAARKTDHPILISYLNAATFNLAYEDTAQARRLLDFDCVYADGQAVVWGARLRGIEVPERVNAGDFTQTMIEALAGDGCRVALIGGRPARGEGYPATEAQRAAEHFCAWAPGLNVVYAHDGFFDEEQAPAIRAALEQADPDLVLLGMGAPLQERWAWAWSKTGRPRVWWCVGALFEYYAGARRRAPWWMRRIGLEWAFRLALEPGRLWRRYLLGNPLFICRLVRGRPPATLPAAPTTPRGIPPAAR